VAAEVEIMQAEQAELLEVQVAAVPEMLPVLLEQRVKETLADFHEILCIQVEAVALELLEVMLLTEDQAVTEE
jgi:hypothetical protein